MAQLADAKVFSILDANSMFWQKPLSDDSALLTAFITPHGRVCFHRLPFGITSAPEHLQRRIPEILEDCEGTVCMMDNVFVYGRKSVMIDFRKCLSIFRRLDSPSTKANASFSSQVTFLGQLIDCSGIRPDPDKVKAVQSMQAPTDVSGVRCFLE